MKFRVGYEFIYRFPQHTPCILALCVHHTRVADLERADNPLLDPPVAMSGYRDSFGNWCTRLVAPAGPVRIHCDSVVRDNGTPDRQAPQAQQMPVEHLPDETLMFLLASRFCETDKLLDLSWELFGKAKPGWQRVQAICDFVNKRIAFSYKDARATRTAAQAYDDKIGVCRDYAHLAVAFCRALNIPARYCTGYLRPHPDAGKRPSHRGRHA